MSRIGVVLIYFALALLAVIPIGIAAMSPLLAWREPIYIVAGFAGVIAKEYMRHLDPFVTTLFAMIAWNHHSAVVLASRHLNTDAWPRRVPTPIGQFYVRGNVDWLRPRFAVVGAVRHEHVVVVSTEGHPNRASLLINNGTRISDRDVRVTTFFVNRRHLRPRFAHVFTAFDDQI